MARRSVSRSTGAELHPSTTAGRANKHSVSDLMSTPCVFGPVLRSKVLHPLRPLSLLQDRDLPRVVEVVLDDAVEVNVARYGFACGRGVQKVVANRSRRLPEPHVTRAEPLEGAGPARTAGPLDPWPVLVVGNLGRVAEKTPPGDVFPCGHVQH